MYPPQRFAHYSCKLGLGLTLGNWEDCLAESGFKLAPARTISATWDLGTGSGEGQDIKSWDPTYQQTLQMKFLLV
jgi:hypothetical protein